jgi:hypothetical protein
VQSNFYCFILLKPYKNVNPIVACGKLMGPVTLDERRGVPKKEK